ncbi:ImmA/IrrE family metallo-endopeptidase [Oceanobacillus indicireducens]|uniref:IrrE N-terminal-like domain-containing protein n=1 Tax=Oceanobacillus indicireducens TaxID=1004261 RepID=A0A918D4U9_9BACI|nr:ImmA/IrrE family metallo-endopeptidase [Oceanobacillus indicireducens]GGN64602.1 hypothetical protein GCM10007971_32660 [Oceanobacillus indicireducens]
MYTHLEDYIRDLLKSISIQNPSDLNIENIANRMHLIVTYKKKAFRHDNEIVLQPGTKQQEWRLFAHELCHYLRHYGNQLLMHKLFIDLQEYQANYFTYHFCVPTFMLDQLKEVTVDVIMNLFNVEHEFAFRRLEMYHSKTFERKMISARAYS